MAFCMASYVLHFVIYLYTISGLLGALRPRGVSLPRKIFYNPAQKFNCLDGSGLYPFHYVNDDFCDCEDGSDEPGTSACSNGIFNCLNHGHIPKVLPSSRVNDGICDCCDTSDEYNSTADCLNDCKELGQQAFMFAKILQDTFLKGQEIRNEYIKKGKEKKEELQVLLDELLKKEQESLKIKNDKQDQKENAEAKENIFLGKEKELKKAQKRKIAVEKRVLLEQQQQEEAEGKEAFKELDVNGDGKLTLKELKSFKRFDYDGDGEVSENEAKFFMHKKDKMSLEEFLSTGWKMMKPAFTIESEEVPSLSVVATEESESLSPPADVPNDAIDSAEKETILKDAALARKEYADADKLLRDIQADIWHVKRQLKADFGEEDEFFVLENQCFEFSEKKYLYSVCPFDKVVQMVKVNQDETLVGLWDKWNGSEGNHYTQMKFSRGASCWNGPNRAAEVLLKCGVENKVTSVTEASHCSYVFEFTTPALCKELPMQIQEILTREITLM